MGSECGSQSEAGRAVIPERTADSMKEGKVGAVILAEPDTEAVYDSGGQALDLLCPGSI